jgi:catechol 2,3-dioxygenase
MSNAVANPQLHHVNLKTKRLDEMIAWYGLVLGMRTQHRFEGGAWLSNDAANHRLALLSVPGLEDDPDKVRHTGMHHSAFEYGSMEELLSTYERLRDEGILPHACLDHGMTTSFYYLDPDGNSVELQSDNFGDWESSTEFVRTSAQFSANPIGVNVDPAQIAAAWHEGDQPSVLHARAYAGEFEPDSPLDLQLPAADEAMEPRR